MLSHDIKHQQKYGRKHPLNPLSSFSLIVLVGFRIVFFQTQIVYDIPRVVSSTQLAGLHSKSSVLGLRIIFSLLVAHQPPSIFYTCLVWREAFKEVVTSHRSLDLTSQVGVIQFLISASPLKPAQN